MQGMRTVGAVLNIIALEPLSRRRARDVKDLGRLAVRQPRVLDFLLDFWRGTGLWMNAYAHGLGGSYAALR